MNTALGQRTEQLTPCTAPATSSPGVALSDTEHWSPHLVPTAILQSGPGTPISQMRKPKLGGTKSAAHGVRKVVQLDSAQAPSSGIRRRAHGVDSAAHHRPPEHGCPTKLCPGNVTEPGWGMLLSQSCPRSPVQQGLRASGQPHPHSSIRGKCGSRREGTCPGTP